MNLKLYKINYREPKEFEIYKIDFTSPEEHFENLFKWICQKKIIWNNETEWRFILNNLIIDPLTLNTKVESRKIKFESEAIENIYLGHRFFNKRTSVMKSNSHLIYILNENERYQNELLTFLSKPSHFAINHMFMIQDKHHLYPRKCAITKHDEGRFEIEYLE